MNVCSADHVARAIVTAARLCDVHPLQVVNAMAARADEMVAIGRARAYAAVALDEAFNEENRPGQKTEHNVPRRQIGRMVGAMPGSWDSMVKQLRHKREAGALKWWRQPVFQQVVAAIRPEGQRSPPMRFPTEDAPKGPEVSTAAPAPRRRAAAGVWDHVARAPLVERNGVRILPEGRIERGDATADLDPEETAFLAALVRVMPSILPYDRLGEKVWGAEVREMPFRLKAVADRLGPALADLGLKIGTMPKMGFALAEI